MHGGVSITGVRVFAPVGVLDTQLSLEIVTGYHMIICYVALKSKVLRNDKRQKLFNFVQEHVKFQLKRAMTRGQIGQEIFIL